MELCSIAALAKSICCGVAEAAFLMLVELSSQVAAMGVDTNAVGTNRDDGSVRNGPICWD